RRLGRLEDAVAPAASIPWAERLPARLRTSRRRRTVAPRPGGRCGDRRQALTGPDRRRPLELLGRRASRLRGPGHLGRAKARLREFTRPLHADLLPATCDPTAVA